MYAAPSRTVPPAWKRIALAPSAGGHEPLVEPIAQLGGAARVVDHPGAIEAEERLAVRDSRATQDRLERLLEVRALRQALADLLEMGLEDLALLGEERVDRRPLPRRP